MDPQAYQAFTQTLLDNLQAYPAVVGFVALGSTARASFPGLSGGQPDPGWDSRPDNIPDDQPDRWSDHDFFVISLPGEQERLRQSRHWLPEPGEIVLHFRETEHGVKVVYGNAHLVEFAVFDLQELSLAQVNDYKVLLDDGGVAEAMAQVARASAQRAQARPDDAHLIGQLLTHLLVGAGRYWRGEKLSGMQFIKSYALADLLKLMVRYLPAPSAARLDNLDPLRRFEFAYPELGEELAAILALGTPAAALGLLEIAQRELPARMAAFPHAAAQVVRLFLAGEEQA